MNENATVVLINGIHTAGVLGAARTFGGRREALRNFHATAAAGVSNTGFECHFEVPALNGDVRVPIVESGNVLSLGVAKEATMAVQASVSQRTTTAADAGSATVLFIAGDRGGSQVNQLQIPTEYHEIQTALRGSEYRGVIALANPILGATRERLAEAYRERPTIVHFAGHGNDRSLSGVSLRRPDAYSGSY